jgi:hypothetical protein
MRVGMMNRSLAGRKRVQSLSSNMTHSGVRNAQRLAVAEVRNAQGSRKNPYNAVSLIPRSRFQLLGVVAGFAVSISGRMTDVHSGDDRIRSCTPATHIESWGLERAPDCINALSLLDACHEEQ